jgi:uncharacterized membrane protein (UPF0127 family)
MPAKACRRARKHILLITAIVGLVSGCQLAEAEPAPDAWVEIGSQRVAVELAESPAEQNKGLGYRDALAWNSGMYFPYKRAAFYSFWMKGMRFPIDIVWIRQGRIVDLHRDVPFEPDGNGPTLRPREIVDAVLEVPAGYAVASGWRVGDRVQLERTDTTGN